MRKHTNDMPNDVKGVGIGLMAIYIGGSLFVLGIPAAILLIWKPQLWFLIGALAVLVVGGMIKTRKL